MADLCEVILKLATLVKILTYHIIAAKMDSKAIAAAIKKGVIHVVATAVMPN